MKRMRGWWLLGLLVLGACGPRSYYLRVDLDDGETINQGAELWVDLLPIYEKFRSDEFAETVQLGWFEGEELRKDRWDDIYRFAVLSGRLTPRDDPNWLEPKRAQNLKQYPYGWDPLNDRLEIPAKGQSGSQLIEVLVFANHFGTKTEAPLRLTAEQFLQSPTKHTVEMTIGADKLRTD